MLTINTGTMKPALALRTLDSDGARAGEQPRVDYLFLAIVSVLLHVCAWLWFQQPRERPAAAARPRVVQITFVRPPPTVVASPMPVVETPPIVEAPPLRPKPVARPKPKPKPQLKPKPLTPPPVEVASALPASPIAAAPAPVAAPPAPVAPLVVVPANTRATSRRNPKPDYPTLAKRRGWEGTVLLEVEVLLDGTPGKIEVSRSSGRAVLDNAALRAIKHWLFEPARRGDSLITSTLTLSIVFKLEK